MRVQIPTEWIAQLGVNLNIHFFNNIYSCSGHAGCACYFVIFLLTFTRLKIEYEIFIFFYYGQIGANLLHLARGVVLNSSQLQKWDASRQAELDQAKDHLNISIRFILVCHI